MRSVPLLLLLAVLLSAAPAHAGPLPTADPLIAPDQFGMAIRDPYYEPSQPAQHRMGELLSGMGVRWTPAGVSHRAARQCHRRGR